jgi:hypothetical protein
VADNGSSGSGYQVEVDSLRAFAGQVRSLLADFQANADGASTHAKSGVARGAFGEFVEATALHDQYDVMRDGLKDVLTALQQAIDEAQQKADLTATNYEEQEHHTSQSLKVTSDGWSVGSPGAAATYGAAAAGGAVAGASAGRAAANRAAGGDAVMSSTTTGPLPGTPAGAKRKGERGKGDQGPGAGADSGANGGQDGTELPSW